MIWKLLRRARNIWWHIRELCNRIDAHLDAKLAKGELHLGRKVYFHSPVRVDGAGTVVVGDFSHLGYRQAPRLGDGEILLQARQSNASISVGQRVSFSNNVTVVACLCVTIGNDCLIGDGVAIFDSDFHEVTPGKRHASGGKVAKVFIGDNVWLGSRAMVLKGVVIGSGSVVAPMSVVTVNVPEKCIVAGSPARVVRHLD
jgi:acetyltransferase-like isoleucine patch superfamily enzyme